MKAVFSSFGGIVPRLSEHSLGNLNARVADTVKLRNGRLEPWRSLCPFPANPSLPTAKSFHVHGCCPVLWEENAVQAAEVHPDWGRFYITGRTNRLEAVEVDPCTCKPEYYYVGVPAPLTPPVASGPEMCSRIADARSYVYTYENKWHEESAPSPASNIVRVDDGATVLVTGIALPPEGYGIVKAVIYRASTGYQNADGKKQTPLTDYLWVGEVEFPSTTFTDDITISGLGPAIETETVREPPKGLQNVCKVDGITQLAGTKGNMVFRSENFQLHNWPVKFDLTLKSNIVHMQCLDQKLYVTTDTIPYVIDVSSCDDTKCVPVLDVQLNLPDISCVSDSSSIITPFGMIYSSRMGVVLISPDAKWHILTARWFSEDDWLKVAPETARFGYWEGYLFIITDRVSFLLDINGDPYGDMKMAELTTLQRYFRDGTPSDLHLQPNGEMFILQNGELFLWNKGSVWEKFFWESKAITGGLDAGASGAIPDATQPVGTTWTPASAKIKTALTEFTLSSPPHTRFTRMVHDEKPFRLPRIGRHTYFYFSCSGTEPVEYVTLGSSNFTVAGGV